MKHIKENNFEGGVGGMNGSSNVQPGYGTFASPSVSQNPSLFSNSNNNKAVNQNSNTAKNAPKNASIDQDINAIYSKKNVPTPDEVVTGINYELGKQIKKNKGEAKQIVLQNLKKNPKFYSELGMLNIDDKTMMDNVTENRHPNDSPARTKITPNVQATKDIFTELSKGKDQKYVVNSQISDVMKEMWDAKRKRSSWNSSK